ncbi:MAG TPA: right-handed parallel beta-helix repeat-containing protein [Lysobacter sp.]
MNRSAIVVLVLCTLGQSAQAETVNCTEIASLPAVINVAGVYCLQQDLSTAIASGNAIEIQANNVVLDCNGRKLGGLAAGPDSRAVGVSAAGRTNLTVRNCKLRGFGTAIRFAAPGGGHVVEDNHVQGSTELGLSISGNGSMVRRNRVLDTLQRAGAPDDAVGIATESTMDILDNTVGQVVAATGKAAFGIRARDNLHGAIIGNRVRNVLDQGQANSFTAGIASIPVAGNGRATIAGNHVALSAPDNQAGISCYNDGNDVAFDNVVNGFHYFLGPTHTPILGCVNGGGNVAPAP